MHYAVSKAGSGSYSYIASCYAVCAVTLLGDSHQLFISDVFIDVFQIPFVVFQSSKFHDYDEEWLTPLPPPIIHVRTKAQYCTFRSIKWL